jgi:acyl dehydratase
MQPMKTFQHMNELEPLVGQTVAVSEWTQVTQAHIDQFAQATGDHQWIHTDPVRAAQGPFGTTIAHGFLTLSLVPQFFDSALHIEHSSMGVNAGLNKVRFTAPVPVNSRLRGHLTLLSFDWLEAGACQMVWSVKVEREGLDKPVCVAEAVVRRYP